MSVAKAATNNEIKLKTVFLTLPNVLSTGIVRLDVKNIPYSINQKGTSWHLDEGDAILRANTIRDKKIQQLETQLAKLRNLEF